MKENRSFDHYFGTLGGVRGFDDSRALVLASGRSVFHQPDPENADGYVLPFRLDTRRSSAQRMRQPSNSNSTSRLPSSSVPVTFGPFGCFSNP